MYPILPLSGPRMRSTGAAVVLTRMACTRHRRRLADTYRHHVSTREEHVRAITYRDDPRWSRGMVYMYVVMSMSPSPLIDG
jgi:hypothetical protein